MESKLFYTNDNKELHKCNSFEEADKIQEKNRKNKSLHWRFKSLLINRIGKKVYNNLHGETKVIVLIEEADKLKQELISKYGSLTEYNLQQLKKRGFENHYEYCKILSKWQGFDTEWDRRWFLIARKNGYNKVIDLYNERAKKRHFRDYKHYENWLAKNKGFDDRNEYRRFNRLKKNNPELNEEQIRKLQLLSKGIHKEPKG